MIAEAETATEVASKLKERWWEKCQHLSHEYGISFDFHLLGQPFTFLDLEGGGMTGYVKGVSYVDGGIPFIYVSIPEYSGIKIRHIYPGEVQDEWIIEEETVDPKFAQHIQGTFFMN